jgi:Kef-type K+ transport system membrane component KefB
MSAALSLILIVAAAYLAAHVLFEWLARRYRIVSGAEYVLLGILLGPQVSGFMSADVVASFAPIMTLALGWTGAALGMNFYLPRLIRVPGPTYTIAVVEALFTFLFVSAVMLAAFSWAFDLNYDRVILPALSLGAIATATSSAMTLTSRETSHPVTEQLETTILIDGAFAILVFGILLCVVHIDVPVGDRAITPTEWVAITLGIGVIGGSLFHLFLGPERNPDRLFIAMAGAIILASGAASYLRLSPLLPAMIIGAILVNTSSQREELQRLMRTVEKPLYFVLLLLAGAAWRPSRFDWLLPVVLYVFVRLAGKLGSARLSARMSGNPALSRADWGRGLIGQGTIALAIALSYSLNDTELVPNVVFTAAIVSVLVTDMFGVRIVDALIDDGEEVINGDDPLPQESV